VPRLEVGTFNAAYKVTKRRDEDISAVAVGFHVALDAGTVATARLAFGGMAATPKRAAAVEAALVGQPWTLATVARAETAFAQDFTPLTDWRASAGYRATIARNLLRRFYLETTGEPVRLQREVAI
jgi:xanthine dehydrogenase small subunit